MSHCKRCTVMVSWTHGKHWIKTRFLVFVLIFGCALWHGILLPDQGSNLHPPLETGSLNHWTFQESYWRQLLLLSCYIKMMFMAILRFFCQYDVWAWILLSWHSDSKVDRPCVHFLASITNHHKLSSLKPAHLLSWSPKIMVPAGLFRVEL